MGLTHISGIVSGPSGEDVLEFLVDSGATYTILPHDTWKRISLNPERSASFRLADGTRIERQISECHITLAVGKGHTPVVLGEKDDEAVLGVVTLEVLGLIFNPFTRTLQPMRMSLA